MWLQVLVVAVMVLVQVRDCECCVLGVADVAGMLLQAGWLWSVRVGMVAVVLAVGEVSRGVGVSRCWCAWGVLIWALLLVGATQ